MAVTSALYIGPTLATAVDLTTQVLPLSTSDTKLKGLKLNEYSPYVISMSSDLTVFNAGGNFVKYISPTEIDIGAGTVLLNTTNVVQNDCSIKFTWTDSVGNTSIINGMFYAFEDDTGSGNVGEGPKPANPPPNTTVVAAEHTNTSIEKNRIGGDTTGAAWDDANGVGSETNALALADKASNASHEWFILLSAKTTAYSANNKYIAFMIEFDIQ